jgi:VWFA-related protein
MTRVALLAACASLPVVVLWGQTPASDQIPTFRTGIDVIQLDITVLGRDHLPVRGLTASDFTILEQGKSQPIVAFTAIDVPPPVERSVPWLRDAPLDVVSNAQENRRLVTIVMDDAYTTLAPDPMKRAKQIARAAVDQLGPNDLAAVVFTHLGRAQNFTSDRTQLQAAIDSFTPKVTAAGPPAVCEARHRSCDVDTLASVAKMLATAPPGRKIVVLISGGRQFTFGEMGQPTSRNEAPELDGMFRNLQRSNVTVYSFDAHGLQTLSSTAEHAQPTRTTFAPNDSLYSFASSTGGRTYSNTNDPAALVPGAFRETSSYYLVGFQSNQPAGSRAYRKVEVKVNRPDVDVRTRSGYYAPEKPGGRVVGPAVNGLPGGDLPLHVTVAPIAVPGRREAEVLVITRIEHARGQQPGGSRNVTLAVTAFNEAMKASETHRQTMEIFAVPGTTSRAPDVLSHLPLRPGRYMVQVAASSDGHTGSVFADVEVPDFSKERFSASGLLLQRTPPGGSPGKPTAAGAPVPIVPTTTRAWRASDRVTAFVRLYQGGKDAVAPALVSTRITNDQNVVSSTVERPIEAAQFGDGRAADHQVDVPIAELPPGDYLLTIDAALGTRHLRRSSRFTIVASGS